MRWLNSLSLRSGRKSSSRRGSRFWRPAFRSRPQPHLPCVEVLEQRTVLTPTVTVTATGDLPEDGSQTFQISVGEYLPDELTVHFEVTGSATKDADYEDLGASVVVPALTPVATVTVNAVAENEFEPDETIILTLQSDSAYNVGSPSSATMSILHCNGYMQGPNGFPNGCDACSTLNGPIDLINIGNNGPQGGHGAIVDPAFQTLTADTPVWSQTLPWSSGVP